MSEILVAPLQALTDKRLTAPERQVLLALFSFRNKATNTVWPKLPVLAQRAGIKDHTRISKITASLSKKGWLTKKKRGFRGTNDYTLTTPDSVEHSEDESKLDSESNFDKEANTKLDSETNTKLDSETKSYEQTSEQTSEQGEGRASAPPARQKSAVRGTRLPATWTLTDEFIEAALAIRPELSVDAVGQIAEQFRDYWLARSDRGAVKRDWLATWRNWIRRENQFGRSPPRYQSAHQQRAELADSHLDYEQLTDF